MSFIWPAGLVALLLTPLLAWLYVRQAAGNRSPAAAAEPLAMVRDSGRRPLGRRRHLPFLLFLAGVTLLLLGLARPEMIVSLPRVEGTVILTFDVSASMTAEDVEPNRLEAAKTAAKIFVENQPPAILLGVVAFGNGGLIVQQPTDDRAAVLDTIERITPQGGTSLGQGIFTALNALAGERLAIDEAALEPDAPPLSIADFSSAVILLFTDGENTNGPDPLDVAQVAAEAGVRVYPVGVGTRNGTLLELEGFTVLTSLEEEALEQIAAVTNGQVYVATEAEALEEIYRSIDLQLTIKEDFAEITAVLAAISLFFMLAGGALSALWLGRLP